MTARRARFAQRRKAAGFSQERLAEVLGVDRSTIVRWEAAVSTPQPWLRTKLADALGIPAEELHELLTEVSPEFDLPPAQPPIGSRGHVELDDLPRRDLLRLFSLAGTVMAGTDMANRLGWSATGTGHEPSARTLDEWASFNEHLWRVFAMARTKSAVEPLVRHQLDVLVAALHQTRQTDCFHRLCELTSDLFQLAGEIFFDGNQYNSAAHCYTLAAQAAREAGARDLWACAMTRHAFIGIYEGQFRDTTPLLESAASLAERGDRTLSTRYWVSAVRAEAFAGLGDLRECERALDHAEEVRGLTGSFHNGGWLRFDHSRLAEQRGACYVLLGQPSLAESALQEALRLNVSPRRRGSVLVDMAVAGLERRDVEQVVSYGRAALLIADESSSGVIGRKLQRLRSRLVGTRGDHRIRALSEDISAHLTAQSRV